MLYLSLKSELYYYRINKYLNILILNIYNMSKGKPSSFSTICTSNCAFELIGLLLSLSVFHENATIYIYCDTKTKDIIQNMTPKVKLNLKWFIELDKYYGMNRSMMERKGIWCEFQMSKARVIKKVLEIEKDTLFLDSDIIILDEINDIQQDKELGVSPQFITEQSIKKWGYYNGGVLWVKNKMIPNDWIEYTKQSRYFDQASVEDLAKKYNNFEFGENYNLQGWRWYWSPEGPQQVLKNITSEYSKIYYKNEPLKFIHTHFRDRQFTVFNNHILKHLMNARMYKILIIIFRVINNKWVLKIPKQPMTGMGNHKNDSYRELPLLMKLQNNDVDLKYDDKSIHCWLEPNILLYDRPTLEWCNQEIVNSSLMLLGNGDVNVEGKILSEKIPNFNIRSWIFWPRRPMILEKTLKKYGILSYDERKVESIFIGNFENSVQEKYRKTNEAWETVLGEYHCTKGQKHKFSNEEYLMKLRNSKFGLCLRGYGSKCHREVELMAFGTVPLITKDVSVSSYMQPLIENTHYLRVNSPEELKEKVSSINETQWKLMSKSCYEWYQKNVHSTNCWNNMIEYILYE